jgi:ABC-type antimicrobial peptide transport system permease subunit
MKDHRDAQPPRWATRLLRWYCRPRLLEDLEGDLNEYFERNLRTKGAARARLVYVLDVLKFCRPYTVRKPRPLHHSTHTIMLRSYLKTSGRSIARNKLFSAINIIGLGISMSVGLLLIAFLADLLAYDDFHEKKDRIYRVISTVEGTRRGPGEKIELACAPVKAGKLIGETVPGVEAVVFMSQGLSQDVEAGEKVLPVQVMGADASFFRVFTFPLLQGNPATALREPYSLVLTEKAARKLFGGARAMGKTVKVDTLDYTVTGVMEDIPKFSHLQFEALVSFATLQAGPNGKNPNLYEWEDAYSNYVYLLLPGHADVPALQARLDRLSAAENAKLDNGKITLSLQPLEEIVLGRNLANQAGPTMDWITMWVLGGLAFVVILSACFNYTNLSIARALRRTREVGMRKVMGALKSQVLVQFTFESVLIALLSLMFSFLLFLVLRIEFLALSPFLSEIISLEVSPALIGCFVVLAVVVGVAAGFLPALFYARIGAMQVLKDVASLQLFRRVNLRKVLIVVQYTLSLMFIAATLIGYKQYRGFLAFDLGFSTENIVNVKLQGNAAALLKKELAELPAVKGLSQSLLVSGLRDFHGTQVKYKDSRDSARVWLNRVDAHYLPLHEYAFLAGTNFRARPPKGKESEVIVNEQMLKRFNIAQRNPQRAVGEVLTVNRQQLIIVGVLRDFHYGNVEHEIEPTLFLYSNDEPEGYLNVKIASPDVPAVMAGIREAWERIDKVHPLEARFYNDQIEQSYNQFSVMLKVIGSLAFLAVCIASMGLFGMVVFTTETRLREISIRKVLGAGEGTLIYLLSKGFLFLLSIAASVALPATYFFFDQVVLSNFAYHQPIGAAELLGSAGAVMVIALLMIGSQALKAARTNPARVLKQE